MSKSGRDLLTSQATGAVELIKSRTVAIAYVNVAPSIFPSLIALMIGLTSSYLFWSQGESDAFAPALMGGGLAMLWRLRNRYWWNAIGRWLYLCLFALFLIERAPSHPVFIEGHWLEVNLSVGLYLCGFSLSLVGISAWLIDPLTLPPRADERHSSRAENQEKNE